MQITVPAMCGIAIWNYMLDILSKICLLWNSRETITFSHRYFYYELFQNI